MQRKNEQTLSISEYARLRGLNKSTISRQVKSGQIPTRDGRIDPVAADQARERNLDPGKKIGNEVRKSAPKQSKPVSTQVAQWESGPTADDILAGIGKWVYRLPELFRAMGASLPVSLISPEVILGMLYFGLGVLVDCDAPIAGPDLAAIARGLGVSEANLEAIQNEPAYEAWSSDAINRFFEGKADYSEGLEPIA
jgi:hypothetical protein